MINSNRKIIVLDTSVLLYDKESIENFPGCDIIIPLTVLDELDRFKDKVGILGENARHINRRLDELRQDGKLHEGVRISNDGTISVKLTYPECPPDFPLDMNGGDNRILLEALQTQSRRPESVLTVVTKDINLRVKCDAVGLNAEDYYTDYKDLPEEIWTGLVSLEFDGDEIDQIFSKKHLDYSNPELSHNTFVVLKSSTRQSCLAVYNAKLKRLDCVDEKSFSSSVSGKNKEQKFALWALNNQKVPLVSMTGLAGSGKTFLALMAGIDQVNKGHYERIIITRNIQPVGKEIGYLPGDADEKMMPWMAPIMDNLRNHLKDKNAFDMMKVNGLLEIAPMSFIRGRTFSNCYIILDEAQNATIHELKTVITRVGEGSKIVLMGDTDQIDTPYINKHTNGLAIITKKLKDSLHTAHIHLPIGIRSTIASEASHLL
jgi:PhoH-like ATPase